MKTFYFILIFLYLLTIGCAPPPPIPITPSLVIEQTPSITPTRFPTQVTPTSTPLPTLTPTSAIRVTPTRTITPTSQTDLCRLPPDDYTILVVNGVLLNRRTYAMLEHAAEIYTGEIDITNDAITQGSYTNAVSASFGTHSGGGAVDLSVMRAGTFTILWEEIPPLIRALRLAGFAAWLRDLDELFPGSPIHIHAIAIGDRHLSPAARKQLTGPYGYFHSLSGLPPNFGGPSPDRFGGPVLCQWMVDMGYSDLRPTPTPYEDTWTLTEKTSSMVSRY